MNLTTNNIRVLYLTISIFLGSIICLSAQDGFGNQWIFSPNPSGTILNFNQDTLKIESINKQMKLEGSCAIMCDSMGKLLFYSNGCYIANANHQMMGNGGGIGKGKLETSYCNTGGNPLIQGIISLPKPGSTHLYYLFYTDIGEPYANNPSYFPLAPETIYYAVIDMAQANGLGKVIEKNVVALKDTFALSMMHANRHANGVDWWIFMPKSHSNCYWTLRLTPNGIDTVFKQCAGIIWDANDPQGQSAFSPDSKKYARFNYFYGLNIFDFDSETGSLSNPLNIGFGLDTFYFNGVAFSPNSRFIYASCYNKLWQFDTWASDISSSRILIGALETPPDILNKTRFNQARLGIDGKIYIAGTNTHNYLHVIHRPNCYGLECNLQQYAIQLASTNYHTMPNMPHYRKWSESDTCEVVSTSLPSQPPEQMIKLYPNPSKNFVIGEGLQIGDEIEWIDLSGKVLKREVCTTNLLKTNELLPGFYFLSIRRSTAYLGIYKLIIE